jgi:hypothetical protein
VRGANYLGVVLFAGIAFVAGASTTAAAGGSRYVIDQRCSELFGICWSTVGEGKHVYLIMESPEHGGEYEVCVKPPGGKDACRPVKLRHRPPGPPGEEVGFVGRVDFERSFRASGAGQYLVRWKSYPVGLPLSPVLGFTLRANGSPKAPGT